MKAIGKYILIKEEPVATRENTFGLITTAVDESAERYKKGTVRLMGELVDEKCISVGCTLYYDSAQGHNVTIDDEVLRIIQERDVALAL